MLYGEQHTGILTNRTRVHASHMRVLFIGRVRNIALGYMPGL